MPTGAESVAGLVALILAGVLADAIRPKGKLRNAIDAAIRKRQTASDAHQAIPVVVERLEEIAEKQDETLEHVAAVEQSVAAVGETVFYLHEDDEEIADFDAFRDRLDVNPPDDFLRESD